MLTAEAPLPVGVEPPPSPASSLEPVGALERRVATLQEALDLAEQQRELINTEYKRLLAEKEVFDRPVGANCYWGYWNFTPWS
jgi:hypothetical protein